MENSQLSLYLEINHTSFIFYVSKGETQNNFNVIYESRVSLEGIINNSISNFEKVFSTIKENIYLIEQKLNYTFKDIILILDNFDLTFINMTGFKKLNGSQILKENIIYILNTLKSCVNEIEMNKNILHIFNSKYNLDNKNIENLPIGLFGDFYSHELSFSLIKSNDYKNLNNIFNNCNLKIKKILIKSFVTGANISENSKNTDTFFYIQISKNNSKIFFYENNSLKLEQNFKFGSDIIIKDISKVTSLKINTVEKILNRIELTKDLLPEDLIEEDLLDDGTHRKIKKKLLHEIAFERIKEIYEIILFQNVNFKIFDKISNKIFLEIDHKKLSKCFYEAYQTTFLKKNDSNFHLLESVSNDSIIGTANKIVHFGWKKEAVPVSRSQKSLIARFFDAIFG